MKRVLQILWLEFLRRNCQLFVQVFYRDIWSLRRKLRDSGGGPRLAIGSLL